MEVRSYLFVFNLAKFGAFFALFGPFGALFGVGVRFKNFFGTYLYRQSTLVLEVKPYLFVFNLATFGASFVLFWALRDYFLVLWAFFWGCDQVQKQFLELTYVVNQLWFWKYSPVFLVFIRPSFGPFLHFLCLSGLFLGLGSGSKLSRQLLTLTSTDDFGFVNCWIDGMLTC